MDHQGAPSEAERSQAIVGAGVTGSGKSTTLDVLSDRAGTFAHLQSAESATASFQEYTVPETKRTLVDAPGQSDPDQTLEDRNHAQIKAALARSEVQSWLFVISPDGSRITAGDEEAYRRITTCFGARKSCILGIVNCDPSHALPTDERKKYREDFEAVLREHKMEAVCWVYVPQLDLKIDEATKQYESPAVAVVRNELWSKINLLRAEKHKELCQRETVERQRAAQAAADQQRQAEAKAQQAAEAVSAQQLEQQRQAAVALEQQRQAQVAALLQEQAAAAVAAQAAAAAQAAEQARLQALADAQPYPVRCEQARGNPCQRVTTAFTVGQVRASIASTGSVPYWNCKWVHAKHCPHEKGW